VDRFIAISSNYYKLATMANRSNQSLKGIGRHVVLTQDSWKNVPKLRGLYGIFGLSFVPHAFDRPSRLC
jgi:hypothetical protein